MSTTHNHSDESSRGLSRRGFIFGLGATLAVVRTPGFLMAIRPIVREQTTYDEAFAEMGLKVGKTLRIRIPESWEHYRITAKPRTWIV